MVDELAKQGLLFSDGSGSISPNVRGAVLLSPPVEAAAVPVSSSDASRSKFISLRAWICC